VRFNVEAAVMRLHRPARDMGDVFSYDIISDGIRMLVDSGHVALTETLAERIATLVLAHPRVVRVSVQVEKLDVGEGIVGVTIERTRDAAVASVGDMFPLLAP
jgi:dihydroneopterin aldolase